MHISYTISYTISHVRRTISYVKILFLPVVRAISYVRCRIRHRTFFGRHRTYKVRYRRTISYVFYLFLPVVRATSYTTSYVFCRIQCARQHWYYTISTVRFLCRRLTSPETYDKALQRRMQYRSIRYAIRSIRYACLGRRQAYYSSWQNSSWFGCI
jgi:hypothetical protein